MLNIMLRNIRRTFVTMTGFTIIGFLLVYIYNSFIIPQYGDEQYVRLVTYPVLLGIVISICGYAGFLNFEKYENKNDGYRFLELLPIRKSEIYKGKVLTVFFLNIIGIAILILINILFNNETDHIRLNINMIVIFACITQIVVTILLNMILRFPFNKVYALGFILYLLQLLLPQIIPFFLLINDKKDLLLSLSESVGNINITIPIFAAILISGLFYILAFRKSGEPLFPKLSG